MAVSWAGQKADSTELRTAGNLDEWKVGHWVGRLANS